MSLEQQRESKTRRRIDSKLRLGFIGGGNMAKAIIEGVLASNLVEPAQVCISHPSASSVKKFSHLKIENECESNEFVVENCHIIVFCVKPQIFEKVCTQLRDAFDLDKHFFVSIVAGVKLEKLAHFLSGTRPDAHKIRAARCMLNTAALIGQSCSVYSQNGNLNDEDKRNLACMLDSVGVCCGEIKDSDMDAAMAVCACGIAYMYTMVEAMSDGAVKMGLTRDTAQTLCMYTMKGASEMMLNQLGKKHPMQLKDEVCSPGGTTIQGMHELERNGFRNALICAVEAATNKAKQF